MGCQIELSTKFRESFHNIRRRQLLTRTNRHLKTLSPYEIRMFVHKHLQTVFRIFATQTICQRWMNLALQTSILIWGVLYLYLMVLWKFREISLTALSQITTSSSIVWFPPVPPDQQPAPRVAGDCRHHKAEIWKLLGSSNLNMSQFWGGIKHNHHHCSSPRHHLGRPAQPRHTTPPPLTV